MRKHFLSSFAVTIAGLALSTVIGWRSNSAHPLSGAFGSFLLCSILAVLEVSLSFDNALVNATVIRRMTPIWQRRFLTWGMLIAVFGMRLVFPLAIVGFVAWVNPLQALYMAIDDPRRYAELMQEAHVPVVGFGGSFLLMVALRFFLDHQKDVHWLGGLESFLSRLGHIRAIESLVALGIIVAMTLGLRVSHPENGLSFLLAAVGGVIIHLLLGVLTSYVTTDQELPRAGASLFLYLEVQDASFSFDGVISAFAMTHNLFLIAIGLGIGAMFVRSMTLALVERRALSEYRYLESGAFWAIGSLSVTMLLDAFIDIPKVIPAGLSALLISASFLASRRHRS